MDETEDLQTRLVALKEQHREIDERLTRLLEQPFRDQIEIQRLKKRKLSLKDEIARLEDDAIPDIIA